MTTMFRRFEIQSELSKSDTAMIYKALDTETNQIVALRHRTWRRSATVRMHSSKG